MKALSLKLISKETWIKFKLYIIGSVVLIGFFSLAALVFGTATDEGFGHGIYYYGDALYFLWTTTSTIGYGDVMMSGSEPILTVLIGIWLATTCGLIVVFGTELSTATLKDTKRLSRQSRSSSKNSQLQKHIIKIVKSNSRTG